VKRTFTLLFSLIAVSSVSAKDLPLSCWTAYVHDDTAIQQDRYGTDKKLGGGSVTLTIVSPPGAAHTYSASTARHVILPDWVSDKPVTIRLEAGKLPRKYSLIITYGSTGTPKTFTGMTPVMKFTELPSTTAVAIIELQNDTMKTYTLDIQTEMKKLAAVGGGSYKPLRMK